MLPRWSTTTPAYRATPNRNTGRFIAGSTGLSIFNVSSGVSLHERLRTRARLTNLAVALILLALVLSLLGNISHYVEEGGYGLNGGSTQGTGRPQWKERLDRLKVLGGSDRGVSVYKESDAPLSIETTIDRPEEVKKLDHLVMVAAHSIWKGFVT
jgi:hypothetical protein